MEPRLEDTSIARPMRSHSDDSETRPKFVVGRKKVGDLLIAAVRSNGGPSPTKRHADNLLRHLRATVREPILCLYSDGEPGKDLIVEWCVPVSGSVDTEQFETRILKGCTVLSCLHWGPKKTLGHAWEAMFDYIEGNNIQVTGPRREIYHSPEKPDHSVGAIELQVPLATEP